MAQTGRKHGFQETVLNSEKIWFQETRLVLYYFYVRLQLINLISSLNCEVGKFNPKLNFQH